MASDAEGNSKRAAITGVDLEGVGGIKTSPSADPLGNIRSEIAVFFLGGGGVISILYSIFMPKSCICTLLSFHAKIL